MINSPLRRTRAATFVAAVLAASSLSLAAAPALAQNAAVVNGKAIPQSKVDEFVKMLEAQGRPVDDKTRGLVRDELIARELFFQQAEKDGVDKQDDVRKQLETMRQDLIVRAYVRDYLKAHPVTDEEIETEYARFKKETADAGKEYKTSHILVEKEEDANAILERLKKGEKFEDLAKAQSKDPGSGANGGDLGWNTPGTFVKEFSDAMVGLKKGETTAKPVKSQFGYHVIRLDDVRDQEPPALDQVRPQLQQQLERQRIQDLQKKLRESAKVE